MRKTATPMFRFVIAASGLALLSACGSASDAELEQKLQRAEAAAQRAEAAQAAAEKAAMKATAFSQHAGSSGDSASNDQGNDPAPGQPQSVPNGADLPPDQVSAHS